jgi:lysozyme
MKMSEQGVALLHEREGRRTKAYRDSQGYWTIGLGHLLSMDKNADYSHLVWTQDQVEQAWQQDKAIYEGAVNSGVVPISLTQNQFDSLTSFTFNVGVSAFLSSTLLKRIRAKDMEGAAIQFNRWNIPPEIIPRRNAEREQFRGTRFVARLHD